MSTTILEYSKTEAAITILRGKFSIVPDVRTKDGYKKCKSDAKEVGAYRINLEKKRKEIKGPALDRCKEIDTEASRIALELFKIEDPLKSAYKKIDKEKKDAQEAIEKAIEERIEGMAVFIDMARDVASAEDVAEWIEQVTDIDCAEGFGKFTKEALLQKNKTLESLQSHMESAINREIEESKLKTERKELEQQKAKQAEKEAAQLLIDIENGHEFGLMMNEKFDLEQIEVTRIEREEIEKFEREKKEQQEKREKEIAKNAAAKAEAEKIAAEERVEQAEIDRIAYEKQAKKNAADAAENARLAEVKRQKDAEDAAEAKRLKIESDRAHVSSVRREIKEQLMNDTGISEETAIKVVKSMLKIDRITISYL